MPHGSPDYWGISVRPSLGAAQREIYLLNAVASDTRQCAIIHGNGILYGGHVASQGIATQKTDTYNLYIDGNRIAHTQFEFHNEAHINKEHSSPLYELQYDDVNFLYVLGIMPGITFESSFEIRYTEAPGRTPVLLGEIIYTII